jgi:16S rRNA (adenine(1408)-N(1))-methyltransferase
MDVGTGDGRAVLAAAAREPRTLALGLDAVAAAMAESSRRAAGPARKGGLPNARFILAAAESPPPELCHGAARVTVQFPWGSLLRGCVGGDPRVAAGIAGLVAPGGMLELLLAPSARDGLDGVPLAPGALTAAVAGAFSSHGLDVVIARSATEGEIAASHSTWSRRLRSQQPVDRGVMLVRLVRCSDDIVPGK